MRVLSRTAAVVCALVLSCRSRCVAVLSEHFDPMPALQVQPHPPDPLSLFGYSLLVRTGPEPEMMVGAPRAQQVGHGALHRPGALHRCALPALGNATLLQCSQLDIDFEDNTEHSTLDASTSTLRNDVKHYKNDMWLGGSITGTTSANGSLLVCAPRWINQFYKDTYTMNGICYALGATDRHADPALMPFINKAKQILYVEDDWHEYLGQYAQVGFAAHITADGSTLLLGAPGVLSWTGSVVRYIVTPQPVGPDHFTLRNTINLDPRNHSTLRDAYFGYSVTSGTFASDGGLLYAAGAPRADVAAGALSAPSVLVFDFPAGDNHSLIVHETIHSRQFGSYFGAALLALDADADGRCDLLVGAPLYAERVTRSVDAGRVYLFLNKHKDKGEISFVLSDQVGGQDVSHSRFGSSLVLLGDIDDDDLPEFAVGAPYEGAGAVYVYSAHSMRLLQRVAPAADGTRGFGVALARAPDLDRNGCHELAVGSLGRAVVLRCRPALEVRARIQLVAHGRVQFCVDLPASKQYPTATAELHVEVSLPDAERRVSVPESRYVQGAQPGEQYCAERQFILEEGADVSRPVEVRMAVRAEGDGAVLAARSRDSAELRVPLATGCGDDFVCRPDLRLSFTPISPSPFVLGTDRKWTGELVIYNVGDSAYGARVRLMVNGARVLRVPPTCKIPETDSGADSLHCDIFSPLHQGNETRLSFELDLSELQSGAAAVNVSANALDEVSAKPAELILPLLSRAIFNLTGWSTPEKACQQPGTAVTLLHHFQVVNEGPTPWRHVEVRIHVSNMVRVLRAPCNESAADKINESDGVNTLFGVVDNVLNCFVNHMSVGALVDFTLALETKYEDIDELFDSEEMIDVATVAEVIPEGSSVTRGETVTVMVRAERMAWWIPLTALLVALLLLGLLIYTLKRSGFFKRRECDQLRMLRNQGAQSSNESIDTCEDVPLSEY